MASKDDRKRRELARVELIDAVAQLGYPEEFGEVMAGELGGEASMRRMAAYLRSAHPNSPEEIADEMLAIIEWRRSWVERKVSERAESAVTAFYNREREDEDEIWRQA